MKRVPLIYILCISLSLAFKWSKARLAFYQTQVCNKQDEHVCTLLPAYRKGWREMSVFILLDLVWVGPWLHNLPPMSC